MDGVEAVSHTAVEQDSARRRSLVGGMIGMFVDSFDIYLPAFVLPAALSYFIPTTLPTAIQATLGTLVFTVTLLGRPLGSLFTGHLGDKYGRRSVALIAGAGFTVFTLLIALLPGYASWGYLSVGLMIAFRLLAGMCLSGGYAGPIPLAIERAKKERRGLAAGLVSMPAGLALLAITLINLIVTASVTHAQFVAWGWRIPFFVGVLLGVVYLIYFARVPELHAVEEVRERQRHRSPLKEFFAGGHGKTLFEVFLLTAGFWLASQPVLSFTPTLLITVLHQPPAAVSQFEFWVQFPGSALVLLWPMLSQKIGRRTLLRLMGAWFVLLSSTVYFLMIHLAQAHAGVWVWIMGGLAMALTANPFGVVILYLAERFPVQLRATGVAVPYQFGLILPSLYSFWLLWLSHLMPYAYTVLVLIVLGGIGLFIAGMMGQETRDWDMLRQEVQPSA
ncbi:MAG: MFS transporter [Firmicutes bacterium]|nr:MFS transporter [Alicyclobacillaceae bacterium]MCL6496080.1 MFS transporter [Bacillota bacterium]